MSAFSVLAKIGP